MSIQKIRPKNESKCYGSKIFDMKPILSRRAQEEVEVHLATRISSFTRYMTPFQMGVLCKMLPCEFSVKR